MGTPPFPSIDEQDVRLEFEAHVQAGAQVTVVTPLAKSYGHLGYRVHTRDGCEYLLKIARIPAEVQRFQRTREATDLALQAGVPAPRVLHVALADRFGGLPYLVQEFLPGSDAEDTWPALSESEKNAFLLAFGEAAGRLHAVTSTAFTENVVAQADAASWPAHVESRLAHLRKLNLRWATLPTGELDVILEQIRGDANHVAAHVVPTLTHRDLFLRNTLVADGRFRAILDFEHARFSDPLMEFVKLEALLFEKYPGSRQSFMAGYERAQPTPYPMAQTRLALCWRLELLGAIPFYARNQQSGELARALARLRR